MEIISQSIPIPLSKFNLTDADKNFLLKPRDGSVEGKKTPLIDIRDDLVYSNFVGEVKTPHMTLFSLPKNIRDAKLVDLIKRLLLEYHAKGNGLCTNMSFKISSSGEFSSDLYFLKKLKSFFLDFVTYEFIYPLETKKIHSTDPLLGQIDMVNTTLNRKVYGDGITYNIIDANKIDWFLGDIYYHTLKSLAETIGTPKDINEINKMKNYLDEDTNFLISDIKEEDDIFTINNARETDKNKKIVKLNLDGILKAIKDCNVNIVHAPIKNLLIDFYKKKKMAESNYTINIFYTKNFEYVWEDIVRTAFSHKPEDFGNLPNDFKRTIIYRDYVPISKEKEFIRVNNIKPENIKPRDPEDPNYFFHEGLDREPDLFSSYSSKVSRLLRLKDGKMRFIGDAKYYNKLDSDFTKEYSDYNGIQNNKYPMVILAPSNEKTNVVAKGNRMARIANDLRELIIIKVNIKDVIEDYLDHKHDTIERVHVLISKRTRRLNNQKINT